MEYQYTISSGLVIITVIVALATWLHQRYCFRHRSHKIEVGPGKFVCPHCHEPNLHH